MGRGRVQMRRIENKVHRQVTFSKRKAGLLKKAHEISVLCDADVAAIVFSTKFKLYEYATNSSMERILKRYERHSYSGTEHEEISIGSNDSSSLKYRQLQNEIDDLHINMRHLVGEDLDALGIKQLLQLEQQLENALKLIKSRKARLVSDTVDVLKREEKSMLEQIRVMENMLHRKDKDVVHQTHQQSSPFFLTAPLTNPALHSSTHQPREMVAEDEGRDQPLGRTSSVLPHWMPRQQRQIAVAEAEEDHIMNSTQSSFELSNCCIALSL